MSTGVIGRRMKIDALKAALPGLAHSLESSPEAALHAAVAITTTDLVSKTAALEVCPLGAAGLPVYQITVLEATLSSTSALLHELPFASQTACWLPNS